MRCTELREEYRVGPPERGSCRAAPWHQLCQFGLAQFLDLDAGAAGQVRSLFADSFDLPDVLGAGEPVAQSFEVRAHDSNGNSTFGSVRNAAFAFCQVANAAVDRQCRPEWAGDLATIGAATLGFAQSSQIEAARKLDNARLDSEGYLRTDHPCCAIAENPCISSIGNGNTIKDVRSPAMSNSVLR
jgi:hypothetical protein